MKAEDVNFESLDNIEEKNVADKFNIFYISSIDNIIKSINEVPEDSKDDVNTDNENILDAGKLCSIWTQYQWRR